MVREPAVSGQFYPADPDALRAKIDAYVRGAEDVQRALGVLCPHAGYVFSGPVAGQTLGSVVVPDTVILLTPSHSFQQPPLALWTGGAWRTPLGEAPMHADLVDALGALHMVTSDDRPHKPEHSGEVIVPFLQYLNPNVRLAVVCVTARAGRQTLKEFGRACVDAMQACDAEDALVVASSDMSHESGPQALDIVNRNDRRAIEQMQKLDPDGLYLAVRGEGITMCGVLPAVAMMESVRARGGTEGRLVSRATSADSPMGGGSYIVGYAGVVFT